MIPFSSNKFLEILNRFLIKPNSVEAEIIKETIKRCERSSFQGEQKYCATSLESMIDFCTSMFGKNIQAFSTELEKSQEYRISGFKKIGRGGRDGPVVCHKLNYPYAVFYCHNIRSTETYMLSLEGADGAKAKDTVISYYHRTSIKRSPETRRNVQHYWKVAGVSPEVHRSVKNVNHSPTIEMQSSLTFHSKTTHMSPSLPNQTEVDSLYSPSYSSKTNLLISDSTPPTLSEMLIPTPASSPALDCALPSTRWIQFSARPRSSNPLFSSPT
ncbi:hypothetical protein TEA_009612 [Camellia sinensis var. sinensis]|uniref:BURP domain-containing protein n=1 Tax=Camellia sinensis var. sinensis TaxID=542762 RepID=A0A4S4EKK1_CAMSN|nr:hypothetical protein TEA_009612 [Camellia sinensis var. sinensis]